MLALVPRSTARLTVCPVSPGIVRPRPLLDPELRLVVLHHAGGSHLGFRRWARLLPAGWEACLVDAPGRGHVAGLTPRRTMPEMVEYLLAELAPLTDRPFAIFGHSMGAVVGFALTAELAARGAPLPVWLGVSAHPGPRTPSRRVGVDLHQFNSQQLRSALHHIGGIPAELLTDDALWAQVEPLLRADLEVAEQWRPERVVTLPVPISAYCGRTDPVAGPAAMQRWALHTERFFGVRSLPGDHFYFRSTPEALIEHIVTDVGQAMPDQAGLALAPSAC